MNVELCNPHFRTVVRILRVVRIPQNARQIEERILDEETNQAAEDRMKKQVRESSGPFMEQIATPISRGADEAEEGSVGPISRRIFLSKSQKLCRKRFRTRSTKSIQ